MEDFFHYKEEDRNVIAITHDDSEEILIGLTGFDLRVIYDDKRILTVEDIQEAAQQLTAALVQQIIDDKLSISAN